jgi:hypothetical protein
MMTSPVVGIVGATGAVGRAAAAAVHEALPCRLRLGARSADRAGQVLAPAVRAADIRAVDVNERASLAAFCAGCDIVVNCAGPSYRILDRVARAAFAAGADYVDVCGNERLHARLRAAPAEHAARRVILSAGMQPGLSGLLPRWMARQGFDRVIHMDAFIGGIDLFSPGAAADYLLGLDGEDGESLAAWRDGRRASRALAPQVDVALPMFGRRVTAHPFLSREAERIAGELRLRDADCYGVFDGERVLALLKTRAGAPHEDVAAAAQALCRAAALDLSGRRPYHVFLIQLAGEAAGSSAQSSFARSLVLRSHDVGAVTGLVAAIAVQAVASGRVPRGLHYADEVLDPDAVVDRLRAAAAVDRLELIDGLILHELAVEEGTL